MRHNTTGRFAPSKNNNVDNDDYTDIAGGGYMPRMPKKVVMISDKQSSSLASPPSHTKKLLENAAAYESKIN